MADETKIPEPVPEEDLALPTGGAADEGAFFDSTRLKALDFNLRAAAGWGALILALIFYLFGVLAIALFLGLIPDRQAAGSGYWHIVVAVLVALFSVPTFLLLSVFRSTSIKGHGADSPTESIGNGAMRLVGYLVDKRGE